MPGGPGRTGAGKVYALTLTVGGATWNVCAPDPERYANTSRINAGGSGRKTVARGVRNSAGFAWSPAPGEPWFTDNGARFLEPRPQERLPHPLSR